MKVFNRLDELVAIKERQEKRRITNSVISEETGLSLSTIGTWRRNTVTRYDADVIVALCKWLPCQPGDLFVIEEIEENKRRASRTYEIAHSLGAAL